MTRLQNSYHRTCLAYAEMASYIYQLTAHPTIISTKIFNMVRRSQEKSTIQQFKNFTNLLKFKEVVPHLLRLLRAGGIWLVKCEKAYGALVKCRIEQVCQILLRFFFYSFFSLTGHGVHCICLCRPGRAHQQGASS